MKITKLHIEGARILEYTRHHDHRGHLEELYNHEQLPEEVTKHFPVQQNTLSKSKKNVLRGIHVSPYAKLLTCVRGSLYDVVVDARPESDTYLQWAAVKLTEDNCRQLLVPPNCGHAFFSLSDESTIVYCQGGCFDKSLRTERAFHPFDPLINVFWPDPSDSDIIMSLRDEQTPKIDASELDFIPQRKRVLIVGASGQVGGALESLLKKHSETHIVVGTYAEYPRRSLIAFDMESAGRNGNECCDLLTLCHPHVIFICAALSWVDGCEKYPNKSKSVNVDGVANLCSAAAKIGAKVVFFSSDYVFDGSRDERLQEDCTPNPVNQYGRHKMEGERIVLAASKRNLVIRTSRVYGPEIQGKNFVFSAVKSAKAHKIINCQRNETSCPTYNVDLAAAALRLVETDSSGIYHCAGPEAMTKAEWARSICGYFDLDQSLVKEKNTTGPAPRPKYVALESSKVQKSLGVTFRRFIDAMNHWKQSTGGNNSLFSELS